MTVTLGSFATDTETKREKKKHPIRTKKFSNFADQKYKPFKQITENTPTVSMSCTF